MSLRLPSAFFVLYYRSSQACFVMSDIGHRASILVWFRMDTRYPPAGSRMGPYRSPLTPPPTVSHACRVTAAGMASLHLPNFATTGFRFTRLFRGHSHSGVPFKDAFPLIPVPSSQKVPLPCSFFLQVQAIPFSFRAGMVGQNVRKIRQFVHWQRAWRFHVVIFHFGTYFANSCFGCANRWQSSADRNA